MSLSRQIVFVRGLNSLGLGAPYYKHASEISVPWPHMEHPLRLADDREIEKWIKAVGNEQEILSEVKRLSQLRVDREELLPPMLSNNLYKPGKVTYTSYINYYEDTGLEKLDTGVYRWSLTDPDYLTVADIGEFSAKSLAGGGISPGHCIVHEVRLRLHRDTRIESITLNLGNRVMKTVQEFIRPEDNLLTILQNYLGLTTTVLNDEDGTKYVTIPFFFSRDPSYGLPLFVYGRMEITMRLSNVVNEPRLMASLEVLHSREEVEQIRISRNHSVEDLTLGNTMNTDKWLYMNCFWKQVPGEFIKVRNVRLHYDGNLDEEIKGVFWIVDDPGVELAISYSFDGTEKIYLTNFHPSAILSDLELRTRILPTTTGGFLTNRDLRRNIGGILFSKYVDSMDCEPGVSPRNGELTIELSREVNIQVCLLTSRDCIIL